VTERLEQAVHWLGQVVSALLLLTSKSLKLEAFEDTKV